MSIDIDTVKKLANLARIETTEEELKLLVGELGSILEYVGKIDTALTDEEIDVNYPTYNVTREDSVTNESGFYTDALLASAPMRENGFVKVKKII